MWNPLRLLTAFHCAQICVGQISYRIVSVDYHENLDGRSLESALYAVTLPLISTAVSTGDYGFKKEASTAVKIRGSAVGQGDAHPENRELQADDDDICKLMLVNLWIVSSEQVFEMKTTVIISITIQNNPGTVIAQFSGPVEFMTDGMGTFTLEIKQEGLLNAARDGLCEDCEVDAVAGLCVVGDCINYDQAATNGQLTVVSTVCGDPHMVGLLGQKIDWSGEDGGWYCLVSDGDEFELNVRLTAPMPEEFPDRQLVSGVSLLLRNGHSLVVEVKDPYTTETDGCAPDTSTPCLADGGLRILMDNEEAPGLQIPGEAIALPEGVQVSATNLPPECRPFGGDRIWAKQFQDMKSSGRFLRAAPITLDEWVLSPDTLAAPTWCAQFLEDGDTNVLTTQSNHATFRIETPTVDLRLNIGINHQDLLVAEDGSTVVPELEFWQTDIALEWHQFSQTLGGMLGDTSRFALDNAGNPIREGLDALHGPVESYRVADALGVEFEKLQK